MVIVHKHSKDMLLSLTMIKDCKTMKGITFLDLKEKKMGFLATYYDGFQQTHLIDVDEIDKDLFRELNTIK